MNLCIEIVSLIKDNLENILQLRDDFTVKRDNSYVSKGDLLVQSLVLDLIKKSLPTYTLISEELAPFNNIDWNPLGSYVILDPIDGTENFVSGLKEWGIGISVYTEGVHIQSCIFLPELNDHIITGMHQEKFKSRIMGLSSSLTKSDLLSLSPKEGYEYRIIGCSMYNTLSAIRGSFVSFENVNGVNCWDILPGLNLALEHGCNVIVDSKPYFGEILFPTKKYKIKISNTSD